MASGISKEDKRRKVPGTGTRNRGITWEQHVCPLQPWRKNKNRTRGVTRTHDPWWLGLVTLQYRFQRWRKDCQTHISSMNFFGFTCRYREIMVLLIWWPGSCLSWFLQRLRHHDGSRRVCIEIPFQWVALTRWSAGECRIRNRQRLVIVYSHVDTVPTSTGSHTSQNFMLVSNWLAHALKSLGQGKVCSCWRVQGTTDLLHRTRLANKILEAKEKKVPERQGKSFIAQTC